MLIKNLVVMCYATTIVLKKYFSIKNQLSSFLTTGNAPGYSHNSCGQLTRKSFSVARVKAV